MNPSIQRTAGAKLIGVALLVVCMFGSSKWAVAKGQYFKVDYPASTAAGELQTPVTYTVWIPDGAQHLRGVIVHQHGAGTTASKEGSTASYDLHWQALARKWDCALMGPSYHVSNEKIDLSPGGSELWFDPRRGSEKTFLKALNELGAKSGHPELSTVPWILWGHSGGGIWADVMTCLHPERVVAVWLRSGSAAMFRTKPEFPQPAVPDAVYGVPVMCNPGVKERKNRPWIGTLETFKEFRLKGAPIGFAPDPRTGHECGDCRYLAIPFFDACMAMRLPEQGSKDQTLKPVDMSSGWLAAPLGQEAVPAAEYKGNANEAVWLPNEAVAKAWMEYVKTGAVSDSTPPPSPTDVKVSVMEGKGVEIIWDAEADFESGIRQFIILRDGQELAKVPEKPMGKFGRPLFQSMTYHDTPDQPMPQMRYGDGSAKADERHTYSVVTVNSVGLKSKASAMAVITAYGQTAQPTAVQVNSQAPTYLYGGQASKLEGDVKRRGGDNFAWKGSGAVTWEVQIAKSGEYAVGLCHAAEPGAAGQELQIAGSGGQLNYIVRSTKGVFRGNMAYEIVPVMGSLPLAAGKQTITLSIANAPAGKPLLAFRSLELTPLSAKAAIEAGRQEARRSRASTEWLNKAGYGLMFHWTSQSIGRDGTSKPFAQAVADFPLDRFVEMVEATGAGYVLFTVGHAQPYCPAPLSSWEKYFPGKTTKRDLIAEMAQALNAKGIKLMCYFPAHVIGKYPKASSQEFTQMTTDILKEFGERYGEKVAGYWFDGFYQCFEKYPDFPFRDFYQVCKAGNPRRIIALNSWIYPNVTEWQEYWAGETASPVGLPVNGTNARGPGQGLRYQALLIMQPYWVQQKVEMPKPQFDAQTLGDYVSQCMKNGGAVTINLGIYQDGSVDPKAVDVLKEVRQRIRNHVKL